jgi:hypothetical protein
MAFEMILYKFEFLHMLDHLRTYKFAPTGHAYIRIQMHGVPPATFLDLEESLVQRLPTASSQREFEMV